MKEASSSTASDPRQPSTARPYKQALDDYALMSLSYSLYPLCFFFIVQYKLCSWLAIIFCAQSLVNMKNMENDLKQISMAMMFAIMGLVTNYFGPSRPAKK
ncbi:protein Asterix [Asparagus officinalis]|uniref:protein Asterix n=1 Tax=Asparagus officinalis TaxID=4686 RepID=UPI00098E50F1|nr:protein Asterix [Asparagus officinalis]